MKIRTICSTMTAVATFRTFLCFVDGGANQMTASLWSNLWMFYDARVRSSRRPSRTLMTLLEKLNKETENEKISITSQNFSR